jgi:hypothetical protein
VSDRGWSARGHTMATHGDDGERGVFEQLRRNVALTGLQQSTRQRNVRAAVADELVVRDDLLTGSYVRETLIGPLKQANVDIVVVLDGQYADRGPRNVLEMVRRVLLKTYPKTPQIAATGGR